jgi:hypothetical protein
MDDTVTHASDQPIGDRLTVSFASLDGYSREITVAGVVVTLPEALRVMEDALRGAGFSVPYASLTIEHDDRRISRER